MSLSIRVAPARCEKRLCALHFIVCAEGEGEGEGEGERAGRCAAANFLGPTEYRLHEGGRQLRPPEVCT